MRVAETNNNFCPLMRPNVQKVGQTENLACSFAVFDNVSSVSCCHVSSPHVLAFAHHAGCERWEAGLGFAPAPSDTSLGQITPGQISKSGIVTIWKVGNIL